MENTENQTNIDTNVEGSQSEKSADNTTSTGEITLEQFRNALENNIECKGYFDSLCDKTVNTRLDKSIESWKEKNLNNLIETEINKRYPQKTESEIAFEKQTEELKKATIRQEQLSQKVKYNSIAGAKGIPQELNKFLYIDGYENEAIENNIKIFDGLIGKITEAHLKANAPKPSRDESSTSSMWDI